MATVYAELGRSTSSRAVGATGGKQGTWSEWSRDSELRQRGVE